MRDFGIEGDLIRLHTASSHALVIRSAHVRDRSASDLRQIARCLDRPSHRRPAFDLLRQGAMDQHRLGRCIS